MRTDAWHCAGWSDELATSPVGRQLLGRHTVLFRDANGVARALGACCPHRGADLSRGSVIDGCIQCPFHGWRFDGGGQCVRVPSQPASVKISTLARVPSFPLRERQGTLWIWMGSEETQGIELREDQFVSPRQLGRRLFFKPQLIAAPFLDALGNAFDRAHVPFIHAASFGTDQTPLVTRQRITAEPDGWSLCAEDDPDSAWHGEPRRPRGWLGRLGRLVGLKPPIVERTWFDAEDATQTLYLEYPNGTYDLFVSHFTPADEEHTWLFVESIRTRAPSAIGDWIQRRAIHRIFEEGERETALILSVAPGEPQRSVSVESDRLGLAVRALYERRTRGARISARAGVGPEEPEGHTSTPS